MATFKVNDRRFSYNQDEFNRVFRQQANNTNDTVEEEEDKPVDPKQRHYGTLYESYLNDLGWKLHETWTEWKGYRLNSEDRWLEDLRQYRGEYPPEVKSRIHPKRSKAYLRLTRTKVKTVDARLNDILFPSGKLKNWGIEPTPVPELSPEVMDNLIIQLQSIVPPGTEVDEEFVKQVVMEQAKTKAEAMENEMEDQLVEFDYRDVIRKVIHSGNLYGTGILKGPVVKRKTDKRWVRTVDEQGNPKWSVVKIEKMIPYCQFVPIWDVYPDMSATEKDNMTGLFQRYVMSRNKVLNLAKRPGFDEKAIRAYLDHNKDGDAKYENHESYLRTITGNNKNLSVNRSEGDPLGFSVARLHKKYQLLEFWGYLSIDQLREQGVDLPDGIDEDTQEMAANVWMLGPMIIKATLSPIEGAEIPYYFYYFDKDETSIFGQGIAQIMKDPQELANASVRALLDNAAISAGPLIEANIELLAEGEDPLDVYPFRVFQRTGVGADAGQQAVKITNQKAYTREYIEMLNIFLTMGDEVTTIPRYMWGETTGARAGAASTATGLSMLMGSANITLKDQVKNFDDGITRPYIKSHYFWNMEFSPKEEIKGDFSIVARGTSSLIAKEVKLESIIKYLQIISGFPEIIRTLDLKKLNDELTNILEMESFSKNKAVIDQEDVAMRQQQGDAQRFQETMELIKAASGGHLDPATLESIINRQ